MAKHLVGVADGVAEGVADGDGDDDIAAARETREIKTNMNSLREIKNAKMKASAASGTSGGEGGKLKRGSNVGDKLGTDAKSQVKGNYENVNEADDSEKGDSEKLVSTMLSSLKQQVRKLNEDLKSSKIARKGSRTVLQRDEQVTSKTKDGEDVENSGENDSDGESYMKGKKDKGLGTLVDVLKKEMASMKQKLKSKNTLNTEGELTELSDEIDDNGESMKDNMEVRIRTLDEKSFDSAEDDFGDDNVKAEVKEATKKMEADVRKQLKEAGLNFKDNIKIKIITTKDKFDQFSKGKGVKLLNDNDAADFKDLLLGFLGGGKEKVKEEQRLKTLENNYNFVYNDDEAEDEGDGASALY